MDAGSYIRDAKTGELTLNQAPTKEHPQGNCARNVDGVPMHLLTAAQLAAETAVAAPPAAVTAPAGAKREK